MSVMVPIRDEFRRYRKLGEGALAQIDDEAFFAIVGDDANSIAVIVKHVAGNLRSRWRDFLTSDGEKPDRDRESEFLLGESETRTSLEEAWSRGWQILETTLAGLGEEDLDRTITIRTKPHTVIQALMRSLAHTSYHVGQIVALARQHVGDSWRSLSIPRGGSAAFNERMRR